MNPYRLFILKQLFYKAELTFSIGIYAFPNQQTKSTATAGALLQSIISRAADNKCYVVMASLDLSMAFDLVNLNEN